MKTNSQLRSDVLAALQQRAHADVTEITVSANAGVLTLSGRVTTGQEKWSVVHSAEGVEGVRAIANEIRVARHKDEEVARMVLDHLDGRPLRCEGFKIHVENGWVILKGTVGSTHQRIGIENVVRCIPGVRGLSNRMRIAPARAKTSRAEHKIKIATERTSGFLTNRRAGVTKSADAELTRAS